MPLETRGVQCKVFLVLDHGLQLSSLSTIMLRQLNVVDFLISFNLCTVLGSRSGGGAEKIFEVNMRADIHPKYEAISVSCSCGNVMSIKSTACQNMHVDVCSQCHPFFTGKQKDATTGGRIDRFNKRFGAVGTKKDA